VVLVVVVVLLWGVVVVVVVVVVVGTPCAKQDRNGKREEKFESKQSIDYSIAKT
jgi:hypothetical protein